MVSLGLSVRRSCELLGIGRSSLAYRRAPDRNAELARRLREIAAEQPRLGCRMAWAQLRAEFAPLNLKRVRRIWLAERLNLRPRKSRRLRGGAQTARPEALPGQAWCMDFAHDACLNGARFKCLAVVDEASRECAALHAAARITGEAVVGVLKAAFGAYGKPESVRCDNGPEFASWAVRLFLESEGVRHVRIQPGSPWQNAFAESFIGTFRTECLDPETFLDLADARERIDRWRTFYNEDRPHSSLGYLQPSSFRRKWNEIRSENARGVV